MPDALDHYISLHEYFEMRFRNMEIATDKAYQSMERRLESMNEFRAQLKDQNAQFVTKEEHQRILDDIQILRESRAELAGKASQKSVNAALMFSLVSVFFGLSGFVFAIVGVIFTVIQIWAK